MSYTGAIQEAHICTSSGQKCASVFQFTCLYTHDLVRKKKRWQDGRLDFHFFNKRIMVYDDQCNVIGSSYWRRADYIQEGDEVELDKGVLAVVSYPNTRHSLGSC